MDRIKRLSNELLNEYSERFGTDFSTNKQALNEVSTIRSKGLKNEIAGYITKILQRQSKFEQRKQILIENEKKSQEQKKLKSKKSEPEPVEEVTTKSEPVEEVTTESEPVEEVTTKSEPVEEVTTKSEPVEEVTTESEPVVSEEKTIAEEIIEDSKSE